MTLLPFLVFSFTSATAAGAATISITAKNRFFDDLLNRSFLIDEARPQPQHRVPETRNQKLPHGTTYTTFTRLSEMSLDLGTISCSSNRLGSTKRCARNSCSS